MECASKKLTVNLLYSVEIHSETRTWHDKNIQLNAPYRQVLTTQLNHLVSLAKYELSGCGFESSCGHLNNKEVCIILTQK